MRFFTLGGCAILVLLCAIASAQPDVSESAQLFTLQEVLPPYSGTQFPANNLVPEVTFPMDLWVQLRGDETTNPRLAGMNFRYSADRTHTVNPPECDAPVNIGPLPGNPGQTYDELYGFDLDFAFSASSPDATNIRMDVNIDSTPTGSTNDRGIVVALIDMATNTFYGYERTGFQGAENPLGRVVFGQTTPDRRNLGNPTVVELAGAPNCRCNGFTTSCNNGYCPETEQAWNVYFSIESEGASNIAIEAFSQLFDATQGVELATGGLVGPFRLGVFASSGASTHNLHGMWTQIRNEDYRVRSRIFSSIFTGTQLSLWADRYLTQNQNPIQVPVTRGPYVVPYMRNQLSNDVACYPDRWEFEVTTTTINQGTPPQWSGGVRSSDEQEYEQNWYFPLVPQGVYDDSRDILVQMHTVADKLNPSPDNRLNVGVTDGSISAFTAGRYFGFARGAPSDRRLGWIIDGLQIRGTSGFLTYDPNLGDNVVQSVDELGRVNLYLTRGGTNTPSYIEIPYDDESQQTEQPEYADGPMAGSFSFRIIQSRNTVPPGQDYVFMEAYTETHPDGQFRTQAFISGGSTVDTSGRRLDGSQILAMNAFQFIGKTRTTEAESELVTPPGQNTGFSMVAFSMSFLQLSCMRRENEPEQFDQCEECNGDNACVDCNGVPFGTSQRDICGECDGPGTRCLDCLGVANGTAVFDACDICDGDNRTCSDCAGVPNGTSQFDACGDCDGGNASCSDCFGVPFGTSELDSCGVCDGNDTRCADCLGVPNGNATVDACGVCNGDNSSCCINYLGVYNYVWDWLLLRVAIDDMIMKLDSLYYMLECENANLPWYDDGTCDGTSNNNADQVSSLEVGNMAATHTEWLLDCLSSFNEMVEEWTEDISEATPTMMM